MNEENSNGDLQTRTEWAQQMAETVQLKRLTEEQQHHKDSGLQVQAEHIWIIGMDKAVNTLTSLVQALQDIGPSLSYN